MKRNHDLKIKLTAEELQTLKRKAEIIGIPTSSYARFIILNATPKKR
jgi:hypothetical protein